MSRQGELSSITTVQKFRLRGCKFRFETPTESPIETLSKPNSSVDVRTKEWLSESADSERTSARMLIADQERLAGVASFRLGARAVTLLRA